MKYLLEALIRFYRRFISPLKPPCCRFYPTCSQYALDAIAEWGAIAGSALALWRLLRCNPFCRGGYDPVPDRARTLGCLRSKLRRLCGKDAEANENTNNKI